MKSYKKCMDPSRSYLIAKKNVLTPPNFFQKNLLAPQIVLEKNSLPRCILLRPRYTVNFALSLIWGFIMYVSHRPVVTSPPPPPFPHPRAFARFPLPGSGTFDLRFARGWGFRKMS